MRAPKNGNYGLNPIGFASVILAWATRGILLTADRRLLFSVSLEAARITTLPATTAAHLA